MFFHERSSLREEHKPEARTCFDWQLWVPAFDFGPVWWWDVWCSLTGMCQLNYIGKNCGVYLKICPSRCAHRSLSAPIFSGLERCSAFLKKNWIKDISHLLYLCQQWTTRRLYLPVPLLASHQARDCGDCGSDQSKHWRHQSLSPPQKSTQWASVEQLSVLGVLKLMLVTAPLSGGFLCMGAILCCHIWCTRLFFMRFSDQVNTILNVPYSSIVLWF